MHHLRRSLRRTDGSALSLTDGDGWRAWAELTPDGARLVAASTLEPQRAPQLVLAQSLAKGRRADEAVRMVCELGVDRIVPVVADRTQGRPDARAATAVVERWRAIAVAALEQSRRVHRTEVSRCQSSAELAASPSDVPHQSAGPVVRLLAVPGAPPLPDVAEGAAVAAAAEVWVAVGPEGGWSDSEIDVLSASGWLSVGLGGSVLRTEHAGPVAVAVLAALSGRWSVAGPAPPPPDPTPPDPPGSDR
jgi:16S rRNA (uracil1498-N3)-methyltransferase